MGFRTPVSSEDCMLAEPDLTFGKAFELAQALESADRDAKTLLAVPPSVHAVTPRIDVAILKNPIGRVTAVEDKIGTAIVASKTQNAATAKRRDTSLAQPITPRKNNSRQPRQQRTNLLTNDRNEDLEEAETDPVYSLFNVSDRSAKPTIIDVHLSQVPLKMELDTGASVSIISQDTYDKLWPKMQAPSLKKSDMLLRTYSGAQLPVLGTISVDVHCNDQTVKLPLVVVLAFLDETGCNISSLIGEL